MTDKEKTELLTDVLHALFGPTLKGKYGVEVRTTICVDADDKKDAINKAKAKILENVDTLNFSAYKIDELIEKKEN